MSKSTVSQPPKQGRNASRSGTKGRTAWARLAPASGYAAVRRPSHLQKVVKEMVERTVQERLAEFQQAQASTESDASVSGNRLMKYAGAFDNDPEWAAVEAAIRANRLKHSDEE